MTRLNFISPSSSRIGSPVSSSKSYTKPPFHIFSKDFGFSSGCISSEPYSKTNGFLFNLKNLVIKLAISSAYCLSENVHNATCILGLLSAFLKNSPSPGLNITQLLSTLSSNLS